MTDVMKSNHSWVRETRFGRWFLRSKTWVNYVLSIAVNDFDSLHSFDDKTEPTILDAGCGEGLAFQLLANTWKAKRIIGVDIDAELLDIAKQRADQCSSQVTILNNNASTRLDVETGSIDIIFCHQLLHHASNQQGVLAEFHRVLSPTGVLLVAESCQTFINTLPVRLLFNHPPHSQKSAQGFIDLVRQAGFTFSESDIKKSAPWWSLIDLGLMRRIGLSKGPKLPTELLIVARKLS